MNRYVKQYLAVLIKIPMLPTKEKDLIAMRADITGTARTHHAR